MLKLAASTQISGAFGQSHEIVKVSRRLCRVSASEVAIAACGAAHFTSEGAGVVLQGQVTSVGLTQLRKTLVPIT